MNSLDCAGFFVLGLIIGGLIIDLRYRYRALVAGRLAGKEETKSRAEPWLTQDLRAGIVTIVLVVSACLIIGGAIYTIGYLNDDWYRRNGYVRVFTPGTESRAYWEYRGPGPEPVKTAPGTAENK